MTVLILYATVEGQTQKIAQFAEQHLRDSGHDVLSVNANERTTAIPFDGVEKVILAAPVHERRHPKDFEVALRAHRQDLAARKTLLLSVSLSAAFENGAEEALDYVTELKMRTEFEPTSQALIAGAVRAESYDYFASQVLRHVVLRDRPYDPSAGSHEFTDWEGLAATLTEFAGHPT